ncbi:MAG: type VII toxin-antitoxin system HepT family RNase toxin [Ignavibacteriaceae bacterium]
MLEKDAVLSKISIIKNCLNTIKKATGLNPEKLEDFIIQDVFVLNLQRAIQACIDIANIIISKKGLKLPAAYKDSFLILRQNNILDKDLSDKMANMVGVRNIAVHEYQEISVDILKSILNNNLKDFEDYYSLIYSKIDKLLA